MTFVLLGWAAGELWTSSIGSSEIELMREIALHRTQGLIDSARTVTWAGSSYVLIPVALLACWLLLRRGLRRQAAAVALSMAGGVIISNSVKLLVARPRPPVEHLQTVSSFSFPSGHATQTSALWVSLALTVLLSGASPGWKWLVGAGALAVTGIVSLSRVYLGVHFPSDVVAGVILGGGWATFVAFCVVLPHPDREDLLPTTDVAGPQTQ